MYIPLSDDKHQKVRDSSKKHTGNPRQIQSKTKCSPRQNAVQEFFPDDWKFFFWTEFCLGLNFVSDYIPQLYFVCNLLISLLAAPAAWLVAEMCNAFCLRSVSSCLDTCVTLDISLCVPIAVVQFVLILSGNDNCQ